ncbi:endonuclease/exonuclease/phosphatase family protein [Flavihumibacter rivuli]|uniref:endonuclease/exonuclease/phosphatase family protein n=1 Tax=Flavihumibacter rivuli TaxID=2838156 RepID=UPI001BDF54D3|nr:endonuclease/exonuclease/phosphatase family protein [Flavihumibacter rivuli]ULQ55349.1 endonuclease/exonuclease/phosphatase family protein [Flavihumibacter rivuli]
MAKLIRSLTKRTFIIITILFVALFLLASASWYIDPNEYWYIAILGVGFAFLLLAVLILLIFWLAFRSKWFFLPFLALLACWFPIRAFFATNLFSSSNSKKAEGTIRVMQWNVARFDEMSSRPRTGATKRKAMLEYIGKQSPDIICMQEFFNSSDKKLFDSNIGYLRDTLKYPYSYYAMDHRRRDGKYEHGVAIFSRYPIVDSFRLRYGGPSNLKANESMIYADININGKVVRVFTTHLQSLLFTTAEYRMLEEIKQGDDSAIEKSKNIFRKFQTAYEQRKKQADMIREHLDQSPYPEIICGDFNDVPNSYVYHKVRGDRKDAFTAQGFGIGRTFSFISPTLRIDYILTDKDFRVNQCLNPHPRLSDHFPVIADLELPE